MLIDTVGMSTLLLPDLQYHFHDMNLNWVVNHAYNCLLYTSPAIPAMSLPVGQMIINWLPNSPQREQLFSRPMPKMPVMAT